MRILIVKLADLGDLLIAEPAIRSLRQAFPNARIDLLTTPHAAPLAELMGHGVRPLSFDKRAFDSLGISGARSSAALARLGWELASSRYDRVVLLHHLTTRWGAAKFRALVAATRAPLIAGLDNGRGDFLTHRVIDRGFGYVHEAEYMLGVAITAGGERVQPHPRVHADLTAAPAGLPERFIAIAPKAGEYSAAREWPLERFADLAAALTRDGHRIVIVGGADAEDAGQAIAAELPEGAATSLAGRTSLAETAATLARAQLLVGNDSFPGHLAAAVGTPVVSIFGPSNHRAWRPFVSFEVPGKVVRAAIPCSPCLYTGHRLGRREGCPLRTCLDMVAPGDVRRAIAELLSA